MVGFLFPIGRALRLLGTNQGDGFRSVSRLASAAYRRRLGPPRLKRAITPILNSAIAQGFGGKIVHVLQDREAAINRGLVGEIVHRLDAEENIPTSFFQFLAKRSQFEKIGWIKARKRAITQVTKSSWTL
jgi:hypothetical protein